MKSWQPLRFKVPLDLLMVLATSYLVVHRLSHRDLNVTVLHRAGTVAHAALMAFLFNVVATESRAKMLLAHRASARN